MNNTAEEGAGGTRTQPFRFHEPRPDLKDRNNAMAILPWRDGHSCAAIARLYRMSQGRVWQIVRGDPFQTDREEVKREYAR